MSQLKSLLAIVILSTCLALSFTLNFEVDKKSTRPLEDFKITTNEDSEEIPPPIWPAGSQYPTDSTWYY